MGILKNIKGSIVAIVTPFDSEGNIDYPSYDRLLDFQLYNGTQAIVVCGTTGETPTLNEGEYTEIISHTVKYVNKRVPVIAGSGSNSTKKAIHYSQIAEKCGVNGLLVVNPFYNKPTEKGIKLYFGEIAQSVNIPIILYNVPSRTGSNLSPQTVLELAHAYDNIIGIKEASGVIDQTAEIIQNKPKGFLVYSGDDAMALPIIALGGDGCISVVANQIPKEFSDMLNASLEGDLKTAQSIYYKYLDLMNANFIESNPIPVKTGLHLMGLISNLNFRSPMCPMSNENLQKFEIILKNYGLLKEIVAR